MSTDYALGDPPIRLAMKKRARREHRADPSTVVMEEVGLRRGSVFADLLVVNGSIHGIEIKSPRDSLRRLERQVIGYSEVVDQATIVTSDRHLSEVERLVPKWWGILIASAVGQHGRVSISVARHGVCNCAVDPRAVVEFIWYEEALSILKQRGAARGMVGKPRRLVWDRLCDLLSPSEIGDAARAVLRSRKSLPAVPRQT